MLWPAAAGAARLVHLQRDFPLRGFSRQKTRERHVVFIRDRCGQSFDIGLHLGERKNLAHLVRQGFDHGRRRSGGSVRS